MGTGRDIERSPGPPSCARSSPISSRSANDKYRPDKGVSWIDGTAATLPEPPRPDRPRHAARDRGLLTRQTLGDLSPEGALDIATYRRPPRRPHRWPPRQRRHPPRLSPHPHYQWGGDGPDTYDCSGFVRAVEAAAGVTGLPHSAAAQYALTTPVAAGQEQPAGLIFSEFSGGAPGHVGIVVSAGQYAHAPHTGDVTRVASYTGRTDIRFGRLQP